MSKSYNDKPRRNDREYWSKRYPVPLPWGPVGKLLTHRKERREEQVEIEKFISEYFNSDV